MRNSRLSIAIDDLNLPDEGTIAVFRPRSDTDLSALPKERVQIIQGFKPDYDVWAARGFDCTVAPSGPYAAALIFVPRAKAEVRALLATANEVAAGGLVIVDGQKTDGIDSLLKECRKRTDVAAPLSKAHGKLFWFPADAAAFADLAPSTTTQLPEGFQTAPGVFSADAVDRGSAMLADALPPKLKGRVADLGAGWGYLAAQVLDRAGISELHLIEAEHAALECAKSNVTDPRAQFHWADATQFTPATKFDVVISNPPFHTSRAADPNLGVAFLAAAARMLTTSGQLWIVANRHLPYERSLAELFIEVEEVAGDAAFKILHAKRPISAARRGR
ncbi:class I SAM-dependent methyltransferase [Actibacterium lipolyticum]|uniref:Ribosomal RNA large subunit methyltransferase G n=1 Tax=Actibacterium lipolyticum TaxID=1524263 RepID=A0A238KQE1_9RHOB|nr:class I SAM-dependent methyltransferase [Actibacterium lipolyticum]SMX45033.1 Ribosomal RNA large subunit methyltransferase G [Actibacterium lipolyticum]